MFYSVYNFLLVEMKVRIVIESLDGSGFFSQCPDLKTRITIFSQQLYERSPFIPLFIVSIRKCPLETVDPHDTFQFKRN